MILQDAGEHVTGDDKGADVHMVASARCLISINTQYNTGAAECARPSVDDFVVFVADLHVLNRIKSLSREMRFREDTLGGDLKAGLSQYIAVEISAAQLRSANRQTVVCRYLPWLYTPPSITAIGASRRSHHAALCRPVRVCGHRGARARPVVGAARRAPLDGQSSVVARRAHRRQSAHCRPDSVRARRIRRAEQGTRPWLR